MGVLVGRYPPVRALLVPGWWITRPLTPGDYEYAAARLLRVARDQALGDPRVASVPLGVILNDGDPFIRRAKP